MENREDRFYNSGKRELKFIWFVLLLSFVVHFFVMPAAVVDRNFQKEVTHVQAVFGNTPFQMLNRVGIDNSSMSALHINMSREVRDALKLDENNIPAFKKLDDYVISRIAVITASIWLFLIRAAVSAESLLLFFPALLASFWIGLKVRQSRILTFSFTSPFLLNICAIVMKTLLAVTMLAVLTPWYLHPEILPVLIASNCVFVGIIVGRLQKNV